MLKYKIKSEAEKTLTYTVILILGIFFTTIVFGVTYTTIKEISKQQTYKQIEMTVEKGEFFKDHSNYKAVYINHKKELFYYDNSNNKKLTDCETYDVNICLIKLFRELEEK